MTKEETKSPAARPGFMEGEITEFQLGGGAGSTTDDGTYDAAHRPAHARSGNGPTEGAHYYVRRHTQPPFTAADSVQFVQRQFPQSLARHHSHYLWN
jgi:hypothetical protein